MDVGLLPCFWNATNAIDAIPSSCWSTRTHRRLLFTFSSLVRVLVQLCVWVCHPLPSIPYAPSFSVKLLIYFVYSGGGFPGLSVTSVAAFQPSLPHLPPAHSARPGDSVFDHLLWRKWIVPPDAVLPRVFTGRYWLTWPPSIPYK